MMTRLSFVLRLSFAVRFAMEICLSFGLQLCFVFRLAIGIQWCFTLQLSFAFCSAIMISWAYFLILLLMVDSVVANVIRLAIVIHLVFLVVAIDICLSCVLTLMESICIMSYLGPKTLKDHL